MKIFEYILGAIVGIVTAINVPHWTKLKPKEKFLLIAAITFAIVVAWNGINDYSKNNLIEKINTSFGDIEDVEDAEIPSIGLGMADNAPRFIIGQTGTLDLKVNNVYINKLLKVYIKNNRLYVNMIFYDTSGIPALGIFENTWKVYNNDFEYNYDNHAIELVTSGTHNVMFHLELKKGVAHIEGCLYIPKNDTTRRRGFKGIKIFSTLDGQSGITPLTGTQKDIDISISPIFKYPKEKYLGVRAYY